MLAKKIAFIRIHSRALRPVQRRVPARTRHLVIFTKRPRERFRLV